jgi:hypothetical protein
VDVLVLNGLEHSHLLKGILQQVNVFRLKGKFRNDFDQKNDYRYHYTINKKAKSYWLKEKEIEEY